MASTKLLSEFDYDFSLVGLVVNAKEHKLCWELNKQLNIALEKSEHLQIPAKKSKKKNSASASLFDNEQETYLNFSVYSFEDEETYRTYSVICNLAEGGLLVPEHKMVNYWLLIQEKLSKRELPELLKALQGIKIITATFHIDVNLLPSKQNFIF